MTLVTPAYAGGESVVGFARESIWGTPPTTGADPDKTFGSAAYPAHYMALKTETFEPNVNSDPQLDDMIEDREIHRIIDNGDTIAGSLSGNLGAESIGWFFTGILGTPNTTVLAACSGGSDNDVNQHVFYPGYNTRANWPAPMSIESRLSSVKSKLVKGALMSRLALDFPNNAPATFTADFIAKAMQILKGAATSGTLDDEAVALPCVLTASPTLIDEDPWHFADMKAYPQMDNANQQSVRSCNFELALPDLRGLFTGGSGRNIGSYAVDKFQASGRVTILFEDETIWYKIKQGSYFELDVTFEGAVIQGANIYSLNILLYSCKASNPGLANKVGDLEYDFPFTCRRDPTSGKSCQITLINSVAAYTG